MEQADGRYRNFNKLNDINVLNNYFSFFTECRTIADIAFLLDGSGSVDSNDFERMKNFVKSVVKSFPGKDTKVGL